MNSVMSENVRSLRVPPRNTEEVNAVAEAVAHQGNQGIDGSKPNPKSFMSLKRYNCIKECIKNKFIEQNKNKNKNKGEDDVDSSVSDIMRDIETIMHFDPTQKRVYSTERSKLDREKRRAKADAAGISLYELNNYGEKRKKKREEDRKKRQEEAQMHKEKNENQNQNQNQNQNKS